MRDRPNSDRLEAFAMMFRCGADVPPGRGRRWAKTQMILEAAAGNTSRADRLDALARALNVPPQALEVEAANHYTALLPVGRHHDLHSWTALYGGPPLDPEELSPSCYKVPCPSWPRALDEPDPCSIGDCLTCPGAAVGCGCRCHHGDDEWND